MTAVLPAWARWNEAAAERPFSVGVEEEVMLIDPVSWNLTSRVEAVLTAAAGTEFAEHLSPETHGSAVELRTGIHDDATGAMTELARLRGELSETLTPLGMRPAVSGTHPFASWHDVHVSAGERQQEVLGTMRELARREPTFALHVHVAVGGPDEAVQAMNRMRAHVPMLLALSANSPYWHGRDSGLASARTPLFDAFPRSGLPRAFEDYDALVTATDPLIRSGAIREPSFLWWDVRLQPRYGTLELRVMDAQTTLERTAALVALVHALARGECEHDGLGGVAGHEVLNENRFRALRDGVDATFIAADGTLVGVAEVLERVLEVCGLVPGAEQLLDNPGPAHQRAQAAGERGLISLVQDLTERF